MNEQESVPENKIDKEKEKSATIAKPGKKRRWSRFVSGVILLAVITLWVLPYGIGYGVKWAIETNGADYALVDDVDFNPFTGELTFHNLQVIAAGRRLLGVSEAHVTFSWMPLFERKFIIERLALHGIDATVERLKDDTYRGVPASPGQSDQAKAKAPAEKPNTLSWGVGVKAFYTRGVTFKYVENKIRTTISLDSGRISELASFKPDWSSVVDLVGRVNGSPFVVKADLIPFAEGPKATINLSVRNLDLSPFEEFAKPGLSRLSGFADVNITLDVTYNESDGIHLTQSGKIGLRDTLISNDSMKFTQKNFTLSSKAEYKTLEGIERINLSGLLESNGISAEHTASTLTNEKLSLDFNIDLDKYSNGKLVITKKGKLVLEGLSAKDDRFDVEEKKLVWDGVVQAKIPGSDGGDKDVSITGLLASSGFSATGENGSLLLNNDTASLALNLKATATTDGALSLTQKGILSIGETSAISDGRDFSMKTLNWDGSVNATIAGEEGAKKVAVKGKVDGGGLGAYLPDVEKLRAGVDELSLDLDLDMSQESDGVTTLHQKGRLQFAGVEGENVAAKINPSLLYWDGDINLETAGDETAPEVKAVGRLGSENLAAKYHEDSASYKEMVFDGEFAHGLAGVEVTGDLFVKEIGGEKPGVTGPSSVDTVTLFGINVTPEREVKITEINLDKVNVTDVTGDEKTGTKKEPLFALATAKIANLKFAQDEGLYIESVGLSDVKGRTVHKAAPAKPLEGENAPAPEAKPEEKTPGGLAVRIGDFTITGDSHFGFTDESVTPVYKETFYISTAQLEDIDSSNIKQVSEFVLKGKIGKYSTLDLKGDIKPFAKDLSLNLTGKINGLDLPPLSSFTVKTLGYDLTSGHMNTDIDLKVDEGQLKGDLKLLLNNLEVNPVDEELMKRLSAHLTMPLDAALSTLKDNDNNITLTLPFKGDINDPQFDLSDVINTAMGKAMQAGAISYLKYVFQPYGTMITVAQFVGEELARVRLDPVLFNPAVSGLSSGNLKYLEKLGTLMKERKELRIKVCGYATAADRKVFEERAMQKFSVTPTVPTNGGKSATEAPPASPPAITDEELLSIANQRSTIIKDHLVEKYGIKAERLFLCNPVIDKSKEGEPRVDLEI